MPPDGVALVSRDPELTSDVRRLCAAAGQELHVVGDRTEIVHVRRRVAVLLVDAASPDVVELSSQPGAGGGRDRGAEVLVLTTSADVLDPWRTAVRLGARQVLTLPQDSRHLLDALALANESPDAIGPLVGVIAGSGGAGASTFAAALGWSAAADGARTTLLDLDPYGGGADVLVGVERADGLRWLDLADARGVVPATALHERLPRADQLAVLSFGGHSGAADVAAVDVPVPAVTTVVAAARRGGGVAVVDLPRWPSAAADAVIGACDVVLTVVTAEVRAVAAAAVTVNRAAVLCDDVRLVVRTRSHARLGSAQISASLGRPVAATVATDRRLAVAADRGELLIAVARSQLGANAKELWRQILVAGPDVGARGAA